MYYLYYLGFLIASFSGCGIYAPTCTDFPMLDGKGDYRLDFDPLLFGASSTLSYGVTDNLFVQAEASFLKGGTPDLRYYGQVSSGWYNNNNNKIVELFGGVSYGHGTEWRYGEGRDGNYATCFLQGNYGWKDLAGSHIDVALGTQCGYFHTSTTFYGISSTVEQPYHSLFFEPTAIFRFGWEKFKFNIKIGYNFHKMGDCNSIARSNPLVMCNHTRIELSLNYHFKSSNQ